jgi:BMFP domain-containing protein YqiC
MTPKFKKENPVFGTATFSAREAWGALETLRVKTKRRHTLKTAAMDVSREHFIKGRITYEVHARCRDQLDALEDMLDELERMQAKLVEIQETISAKGLSA